MRSTNSIVHDVRLGELAATSRLEGVEDVDVACSESDGWHGTHLNGKSAASSVMKTPVAVGVPPMSPPPTLDCAPKSPTIRPLMYSGIEGTQQGAGQLARVP